MSTEQILFKVTLELVPNKEDGSFTIGPYYIMAEDIATAVVLVEEAFEKLSLKKFKKPAHEVFDYIRPTVKMIATAPNNDNTTGILLKK